MGGRWHHWIVVAIAFLPVACQAAGAPPASLGAAGGLSISTPPDAAVKKIAIYLSKVEGYGEALWVDVDVHNGAASKRTFAVTVKPDDLPQSSEESRPVEPNKAGTVKVMTILKGKMPSTLRIDVEGKDAK